MPFTELELNWKKQAAAESATAADVERAFGDTAYQAVSNKCSPWMKPPYRVGFEVVHKNDENTRMVGIFIFRINRKLYYVPVFFINGSVKGADLCYSLEDKRFTPLTSDWTEFLLNGEQAHEGTGVPYSERQLSRQSINLHRIFHPSQLNKLASTVDAADALTKEEKAATTKLVWEDMCEVAATELTKKDDAKQASILRKFIMEDGGYSAIEKIANTARHDFEFAEALFLASSADNYNPDLDSNVKQAKAHTSPLVIHTGLLDNANVKNASAEDIARGYQIVDERKESQLNDGVYVASTGGELATLSEPGVYQVLDTTGGRREMIFGHQEYLPLENYACPAPPCCHPSVEGRNTLVDLENKHSEFIYQRDVFGQVIGKIEDHAAAKTEPETGKAYRLYNGKSGGISSPFYVIEKSKSDSGLTEIKVSSNTTDDKHPCVFLLNPDYDGYDYVERVLGKCCKFIEVAFEVFGEYKGVSFPGGLSLGTKYALDQFIFDNGYKKVSVCQLLDGEYSLMSECGDGKSRPMGKVAAIGHLMAFCDLKEQDAEDIVNTASKAPMTKHAFFYKPFTKQALNLRFNNWPQFLQDYDPDYGVLNEPETHEMLPAEYDVPFQLAHRIGDKVSLGTPDAIETMRPMQLYQLSQEKGMGSLFEHGVVGSLTNTYDSISMIDKYLPDMQQALDRIGRIIFLFYWKPEDFAQAYGSDDQSQLENKLTSNFRSFGDLVLELLKKTQNFQHGSVSMT